MARKKKIWNEESLNILYECWKVGEKTKDRIPIIQEKLPQIPLPMAISVMRKLEKTDSKWLKWATRKKNEIEKEKLLKQQEKERKILDRENKRKERAMKKEKREKENEEKEVKRKLDDGLELDHSSIIAEKIIPEFFFCPDIHQFVNNNSCIYRVFSKDFPSDSVCNNCNRMDKYIPIIKEVVSGEKNSPSNGDKDKE